MFLVAILHRHPPLVLEKSTQNLSPPPPNLGETPSATLVETEVFAFYKGETGQSDVDIGTLLRFVEAGRVALWKTP